MKNATAEQKPVHDATNEVIDRAEEKIFDTMERAREVSDTLIDSAGVAEEQIQKIATSTADSVSKMVRDKPLQAAGIAFTAGVIATLLLTRNKS